MDAETNNDPEVDMTLIRREGDKRLKSVEKGDEALDAIVAEIRRSQRAGGRPNIKKIAEASAVARSTIYERLEKETYRP